MAALTLSLHLIFCTASLLLLAFALRSLRGSTLASPIVWSMGAVSSIGVAEVVLFFPPMPDVTSWQSLVRYAAGTVTLLPVISVLGAKRPQALLWNYIVASLWIVLLLPAAEVLLLKPQQTFEIYAFGPWLIAGLIFLTVIHYAGTRMTMLGLFVAAAQILYLGPHLPIFPLPELPTLQVAASALLFIACVWGALFAVRKGEENFDRVWTRFQSGYGTAWSLRIIQRLDELQARSGWCVRLGFYGVEATDPSASPEKIEQSRRALARAFRSLMLRFFSPEQLEGFSAVELGRKAPAPVSTTSEA